jgi:formylglycine-generating enzyme required for sulfatase activity
MQTTRRKGFTVGEFIVFAIIFIVLCVGCYYLALYIRSTASNKIKENADRDSEVKEKFTKFALWEFPKNSAAGQEVTQLLGDSGVGITFCWIQEGKFQRGQNEVSIDKGFWIAKYETTQAQWNSLGVRKKKDSQFKGDCLPVESVSYDEALSYAQKLKDLSGCGVRLPKAVEWTYACFAGLPTRYFTGDTEADLGKFAWYHDNSDGKTHPVGEKLANQWGLHDMAGNVAEWCSDSPEDQTNDRYVRGGSWDKHSEIFKSTYWIHWDREDAGSDVGFRLVVDPTQIK